jgi:hypothetical protein
MKIFHESIRKALQSPLNAFVHQGRTMFHTSKPVDIGGYSCVAHVYPDEERKARETSRLIRKLAELEERILEEGNELGIGPMGFGGKTTLLGVKIGALHRLPASYFVSIAYMCWANRRASMDVTLTDDNVEVHYA